MGGADRDQIAVSVDDDDASESVTTGFLDFTPFVAAGFAVPQFVPQIARLHRTRDRLGLSWSWATLTSVNNAAWLVYFVLSRYWTAVVPATSATVLAGILAAMLARRNRPGLRPVAVIVTWTGALVVGLTVAGRAGLGALLTAAFVLQVSPSLWTAYRTDRPTGISAATWALVLGELTCWSVFGIHSADLRLTILGFTGVTASLLMLRRVAQTQRFTREHHNPGADHQTDNILPR